MKNGQNPNDLMIDNLKNYSSVQYPEKFDSQSHDRSLDLLKKATFDLRKFNLIIVSPQFQPGTKLILKLEFLDKKS
jgi:hypothetical protein